MKPALHARSSVRKYGGSINDYVQIHQLMDMSKAFFAGPQHRALFHHTLGTFFAESVFGYEMINSDGKIFFPRDVAEDHVVEDMGGIVVPWMWWAGDGLSVPDGLGEPQLNQDEILDDVLMQLSPSGGKAVAGLLGGCTSHTQYTLFMTDAMIAALCYCGTIENSNISLEDAASYKRIIMDVFQGKIPRLDQICMKIKADRWMTPSKKEQDRMREIQDEQREK